jgi:hypothetical protein
MYFHTTKTNKVKEVGTFPAHIHTAVTPEEKKKLTLTEVRENLVMLPELKSPGSSHVV